MTPETVTELDQRTRNELAPSCDLPRNGAPCPEHANWIVWVVSAFGTTPKLLACDEHKKQGEDHIAGCAICRAHSRFHAEPLR